MFKKAYIPRTLTEVKNYERDVDIMMKLKEEDMALNVQQDNVSRPAEVLQKRRREYEFFLLIKTNRHSVPNLVSRFQIIWSVLMLT